MSSLRSLLPFVFAAVAFALVGIGEAHAAPWSAEMDDPVASEVIEHASFVVELGAACIDGLQGMVSLVGLDGHGRGGDPHSCATLRGIGFAFLALAALVVIALGRMRHATEQKRLEVARRLIEQGIEPPAGLLLGPARNDLRRGIVLIFAGAGLLAAGLVLGDRALTGGGLVPEFIGVGYLVSWWLAMRRPGEEPKR